MFRRAAPLLVSLLLTACAAEPAPVAKNAILVVVDTLRADHLGAYGATRDTSPAFDAWADRSVRFERAYSSAPWTKASVASLFSGLYPTAHGTQKGMDGMAGTVETLAETLAGAGFATLGVVSHSLLKEQWGFTQGFAEYHDAEAQGHQHVSTEGVTRRAIELLEQRAERPGRFFLFVHYFDPHYSYVRHSDVGFAPERAGAIDGSEPYSYLRAKRFTLGEPGLELLRALYDEEIHHTDAGFGRLLARLGELGLADDTLVVFTADHGEEFMERGWLGHTRTLYDELVRVPLVVNLPGTPPRSVPEPVSLVSVMPTLLDLLGVEATGVHFDAPSLAAAVRGREMEAAPVYSEVDFVPIFGKTKLAFKKAVIGPRYKLIFDNLTGEFELYDLANDPGETRNVAGEQPEEAARLLALLQDHLDREAPRHEHVRATRSLAADEVEQLRGLGYVDEN